MQINDAKNTNSTLVQDFRIRMTFWSTFHDLCDWHAPDKEARALLSIQWGRRPCDSLPTIAVVELILMRTHVGKNRRKLGGKEAED